MSKMSKIFGLEDANQNALRLVQIMVVIFPAMAASFQISTTFWMIHIAESLGNGNYIDGIGLVGVLVVLQLVIQTVLDYPTGALGDHIGHRYVFASALLSYSIAFLLTATVNHNTPFYIFVMIYVLIGFGSSQESGTLSAWFDNNYRHAMPEDKDRKQYGVFSGRLRMLFQVTSTLVLVPGSLLALATSREWVFQLQAVLFIVLALAVLRLVKDSPEVEAERVVSSCIELGQNWTCLR